MRDRATFDRVLAWTEAHLKRPDGLYSWLFSPVEQRLLDANTATDADQDIAYALVIAAQRLQGPTLSERAREIVKAVRTVASITWSERGSTAGSRARETGPTTSASSISPISYPTPIPSLTNSTPRGSGSPWSAPAMISWRVFATEGVMLPLGFHDSG